MTAEEVIRLLELEELQGEGGMYRQTYLGPVNAEGVHSGTAIYYMLTPDTFSHLHKLTGDEVYHFYLGDPVELCLLYPDGRSEIITLGQDLLAGEQVQYTVPAGVWQGSSLKKGGSWGLMGTTMSPGYTDESYEHGNREKLLAEYPEAEEKIRRLTSGMS